MKRVPADAPGHDAAASLASLLTAFGPLFTAPSFADMVAKLRRVIIAARFKASRPGQPTPEEIRVIRPGLGRPRRITAKVE
jgi:hypothetical protein